MRELLTHAAGFVTTILGDRQTPLPEEDFILVSCTTACLSHGRRRRRSILDSGYALLGRIVAIVSGQPTQSVVERRLLTPSKMTSTSYDVAAARRNIAPWLSLGRQRLELSHDGARRLRRDAANPDSATDYARSVASLLSASAPHDGANAGPCDARAYGSSAQGANLPSVRLATGSKQPKPTANGAYGIGFSRRPTASSASP